MCGVALHGLHEIRNEVVATLQLYLYIGPRLLRLIDERNKANIVQSTITAKMISTMVVVVIRKVYQKRRNGILPVSLFIVRYKNMNRNVIGIIAVIVVIGGGWYM